MASAGRWHRLRHWLPVPALALFVAILFTPEAMRLQATLVCVSVSVILLVCLEAERGIGGWLSHSLWLWLGVRSYSLYLWHWPVIVLARWSVGLDRVTLLPILLTILLATLLSYRLETRFRRPPGPLVAARQRAIIRYPLLSLAGALALGLVQGPARGALFLGDRSRLGSVFANGHQIAGTAINTANCFQEPTASVLFPGQDQLCLARPHPGQPTVYFEGDSHTEMLMPLGQTLLTQTQRNVSFHARGSCPVPWFRPWANGSDQTIGRQGCAPYSRGRVQWLAQHVQPGDLVVLAMKLPSYTISDGGPRQHAALAAADGALRDLAGRLQARGADLIVFGPLPFFPQRPKSLVPRSLCLTEWYRPVSALDPGCRPQQLARVPLVRSHAPLNRELTALEAGLPNLHIFRTFPLLCPPAFPTCSTHRGDRMTMADSNHLSEEGVRLLEQPFLRLIARLPPPPHRT